MKPKLLKESFSPPQGKAAEVEPSTDPAIAAKVAERRAKAQIKVSFDKNKGGPRGAYVITGELEGQIGIEKVAGGVNVEKRIETVKAQMLDQLVKRCEFKDAQKLAEEQQQAADARRAEAKKVVK
jgi:hypothetical protein